MNDEIIIVALVMGLFVLAAIVCAWRQFYEDKVELDELRYRMNIMDEVLSLHSEELDELHRDKLPMADRLADVEKRMMEPSFDAAVDWKKELEDKVGGTVHIRVERKEQDADPSSVSAEH